MALDAMEEQAFDPVRALASLSPASLLCPSGPLSVLGSGEIGVVFLEEESGEVVKVMLEDFAKKEYDVFCAFAKAGLTPFPLAFHGPCTVPGGELYSIRMKRIQHTLHDVLWATAPCGPRRGLSPPSASRAREIGAAMVQAMQRMWDEGLVHGDLHLKNVGLKEAQPVPIVQLIDFGRSAARSLAPPQSRASTQACRAGHEYDVCRLVVELCESFENLVCERDELAQECKRELRELRRAERDPGDDTEILHRARLIAGFEAFLADEPRALAQAEAAYNAILDAVMKYASVKHDISVDGVPSIRQRNIQQLCKRRMDNCDKLYFKSALFWQED
jgi:tRNA A-37 threonylcarbamoyl transferase component Bud32